MEQPKARLTLQQSQQAINEAIWIDASHEWPTIDKMWLLCSALIDSVQMVDYLRSRLAAVEAERDAARAASEKDREWVGRALEKQAEYLGQSQMLVAERDAARAGEARAVEALRRCYEGAARQLAEPRDHDNDQCALTAIATGCEAVLEAQEGK